jgi:proliferating cell nuclear antigen
MLLKLDQPQTLADVVSIISDLVSDVRLKVTEDGMSMTAIDPANVSMVSFIIPRTSFSQFEVGSETLGVNLDNLKSILKRCKAGSSLILETEENTLKVQILDKIKRSFVLSLIDITSEEKQIPNLEFSSRVEIDSSDFVSAIEDCLVVSDACSFIIKDGKFLIEAKSLNSAMSEFSADEVKIEAENCKSKYSLEYLQKFVKGSKLTSKTVLRFANDYPLRIDYQNDKVGLSFILAPRVESDN